MKYTFDRDKLIAALGPQNLIKLAMSEIGKRGKGKTKTMSKDALRQRKAAGIASGKARAKK